MINVPAHTSWLLRGTMSTPVYLWRIPDALIGKLEGLKPPRVALVSLHLGAFSFPESETMFPVSNPIATPNARTMSSREIADIAEARHNDLVATIDRLFDKGLLRSSRKTTPAFNRLNFQPITKTAGDACRSATTCQSQGRSRQRVKVLAALLFA